ncbi:MAG: IS1634 family transposase, partial [Bacteroidetes bacterium]|nr:IS1634 family transposase [Bacteroidota bacterium]
MFFVEKKSKNSKTPVLQLVENVKTEKGSRQRIVVSLGTYFKIPKAKQKEIARIVKYRLIGQTSFIEDDPGLLKYADQIIRKIQIEGKWDSERNQVDKFKREKKEDKIVKIFIDKVEHGYTRELGSALIGHHFWGLLGFPALLKDLEFNPRQIDAAEVSILNRLIAQDSEHSILSWLKTVALEDILNIDTARLGSDRFYRISDKLLKCQSYLEKGLYKRQMDFFNVENGVFLYDLTNTYFEGSCSQNPKAKHNGNQKEKRTDCPQVVVSLVLDNEGFIRRHRIFEGNISDSKSLKTILAEIQNEFKNQSIPTIIFDRGVVSEDNIKLIEKHENLKYIVICRTNEELSFIDDFQSGVFTQVEGRDTLNKTSVDILLKEKEGINYLLCKSEGRKAKETVIRNNAEEKLKTALLSLKKGIQTGRENDPIKIERKIGRLKERYSRVAKYYEIEYRHRKFSYDYSEGINFNKRFLNSLEKLKTKADNNKISFPALKKKLDDLKAKNSEQFSKLVIRLIEPLLTFRTMDEIENKERKLDGNYLLKTNRTDLDQNAIWNLYMMLTGVEEAFRNLKSHLGLRPNFHQKEIRV